MKNANDIFERRWDGSRLARLARVGPWTAPAPVPMRELDFPPNDKWQIWLVVLTITVIIAKRRNRKSKQKNSVCVGEEIAIPCWIFHCQLSWRYEWPILKSQRRSRVALFSQFSSNVIFHIKEATKNFYGSYV